MNKKIGVAVASTLFLIVVLSTPLTFAQGWTSCELNAQSEDFVANDNGFSFWVISPVHPTPNTIEVSGSAGSYNWHLSPGERVVVSLSHFNTETVSFSEASGHVVYSGPADSVTIDEVEIPEFPSFLILPLFIIGTLLAAIVLRRKLAS